MLTSLGVSGVSRRWHMNCRTIKPETARKKDKPGDPQDHDELNRVAADRTNCDAAQISRTGWLALTSFCGTNGVAKPLTRTLLLRVASRNPAMSKLALLSNRRVPLYVSVPIIIACAATGFLASATQSRSTATGKSQIHRSAGPSQGPSATTTVEKPPRISDNHLSAQLTPPRDAASLALPPLDDSALPLPSFPASAGLERDARGPGLIVKPAPQPLPVTTSPPQRTRATRAEQPAANAQRPQRTVQQHVAAPSPPSAGLKNIPILGPVFSLFQ